MQNPTTSFRSKMGKVTLRLGNFKGSADCVPLPGKQPEIDFGFPKGFRSHKNIWLDQRNVAAIQTYTHRPNHPAVPWWGLSKIETTIISQQNTWQTRIFPMLHAKHENRQHKFGKDHFPNQRRCSSLDIRLQMLLRGAMATSLMLYRDVAP